MAFQMKGQGATEYLVLLAVVLIIALVSISLLGFFPGLASDAKITQSTTYWRGEARPISIVDSSFDTNGSGNIVVVNNDAAGTLVVTGVSILPPNSNGTAVASAQGLPADGLPLASGDQATIPITGISGGPYGPGATYEYTVVFTYTTAPGLSNVETGSKTLMGKYH